MCEKIEELGCQVPREHLFNGFNPLERKVESVGVEPLLGGDKAFVRVQVLHRHGRPSDGLDKVK